MSKTPAGGKSSAAGTALSLPAIPGSPSAGLGIKSKNSMKEVGTSSCDNDEVAVNEDAALVPRPPKAERKKQVCTCKSPMFPPDSEQANFFLPKLEHKCSCGAMSPTSAAIQNPTLLSNILRPWQADFLRSMGVTTATQLVQTYKAHGKDLSCAMAMWRQNRGLKKARKKSCYIALHIWTRTSKLALRNEKNAQARTKQGFATIAIPSAATPSSVLEDCCNRSLDTNVADDISICSSLGNESVCRDRFNRIEI